MDIFIDRYKLKRTSSKPPVFNAVNVDNPFSIDLKTTAFENGNTCRRPMYFI